MRVVGTMKIKSFHPNGRFVVNYEVPGNWPQEAYRVNGELHIAIIRNGSQVNPGRTRTDGLPADYCCHDLTRESDSIETAYLGVQSGDTVASWFQSLQPINGQVERTDISTCIAD